MTESQTRPSDDQLFFTLVTDLVTQAWVALGKIKHPITDKIERNVPAAGIIIDMLDMLNRKTAGNRTEGEDRLLLDSLQQLKLNFVAEANKPEEVEEPVSKTEEVGEEAGDSEATGQEKTTARSPSEKKTAARGPKSTSAKKAAVKAIRKKKSGPTKSN